MSLTDEIQKVQSFVQANTPHNEASTCQWVILPLLYGAGYGWNEVSPQVSNAAQKIPDYTILPNSQFTWYLEAKDWNKPLQSDQDLFQAISYANHSGHRWVVLSNGSEWHLYDDFIKGVSAPQKLVASAHLDKAGEIEEFLAAVGRTSVCSGLLESYASKSRLSYIIKSELYKPGGKLLAALNACLHKDFGISGTQPLDILKVLGQASTSPRAVQSLPITIPPTKTAVVLPPTKIPDVQMSSTTHSLEAIYHKGQMYLKDIHPSSVVLPGSLQPAPLSNWADLAAVVVEWIAEQNNLPDLPFRTAKTTKASENYLNTSPIHAISGKPMRHPKKIVTTIGFVYINTHGNAVTQLERLRVLCQQTGVNPADIQIQHM